MKFGITPPDCQCPMNFTAFNAYAYHQQKVEDFIDILAAADDPNDEATQWDALRQVGLNANDLSPADLDYIEKEVARRWQ